MSKLADAIRRSQRVEAAPMGFGAARATPKATMLVGVLIPPSAAGTAKDADVVILDARSGKLVKDEAETAKAAGGDAVLGAWVGDIDRDGAKELHAAGVDFLVFAPETTPASALLEEDLGYVLTLPAEPEEAFLRTVEGLSLDAIALARVPSPLTVAGQMELGRVGMLARKPMACLVQADADKSDLECLRAAGVVFLILDGDGAGVATLKEAVLALPPRRQRRDERPAVSLPRAVAAPVEDDEEDD